MYGYIYITTNDINGKIYIGQHISESFDEKYKGSGVILQKAIKKYGFNSFTTEILHECNSIDEMNYWEQEYIKQYNATDKNIGYNIKYGGSNTPCPEEVKKKISEAEKRNPARTMLGKRHTEETKQKIRNSALGKPKSEEAKKKMSLSKKGVFPDWFGNDNKVWVTNGQEQHIIPKEDIQNYKDLGFYLGRLEPSEEQKKKYKDMYADRVYINKDGKDKNVHEFELAHYISDGWELGKSKIDRSSINKNISNAKKGKIKVTKGSEIRYIDKELLQEYIDNGYERPLGKKTQ